MKNQVHAGTIYCDVTVFTRYVTGIKVEQQLDDVRVSEPPVHVQFVTATVAARRPNAFDGHRAVVGAQRRPVNGAERAGVQHGDARDSEPDGRVVGGGVPGDRRRHRRDVVARPTPGRQRTAELASAAVAMPVHFRRLRIVDCARNTDVFLCYGALRYGNMI